VIIVEEIKKDVNAGQIVYIKSIKPNQVCQVIKFVIGPNLHFLLIPNLSGSKNELDELILNKLQPSYWRDLDEIGNPNEASNYRRVFINMFKQYVVTPTMAYEMYFKDGDGSTPNVREFILLNRIKTMGYMLVDVEYWCGNDMLDAPTQYLDLYIQHLRDGNVIEVGPNRTQTPVIL